MQIKCNKCGKVPTDQTKFAWKCNSCGKAFGANLDMLKKVAGKKQKSSTAILKCKNCGKFLDDGNEQIYWKCSCGTLSRQKLSDFDVEQNQKEENSQMNQTPQANLIQCPDCGKMISKKASACPHCGCPIEIEEVHKPQKVEVTKVKLSITKKKRNIIIAIFLLLIVGSVGGYFTKQYFDKKNAEKIASDYKGNLSATVSAMWLGAYQAEKAGGLIHDVWYNTIYEKSDETTDKYTKKDNGFGRFYFCSDFNEALGNLFIDSSFSSDIQSIKDNQNSVQMLMKKAKNPPEEYKEAYDALKELYDAYTKLVNCAINPTGNLQSYTSDYNDADTNTLNCYKNMAIYIDD